MPDSLHCAPVADWDPSWSAWEEEVLALTNQERASGANCGSQGVFGPAPPLTMHPSLRCSARLHSVDMINRSFFDHVNPDGDAAWDRMTAAGYPWSTAGENIAGGQTSPAAVVAAWMESDGHCANIMHATFEELGVGYAPGGSYAHYWTQNFGTR